MCVHEQWYNIYPDNTYVLQERPLSCSQRRTPGHMIELRTLQNVYVSPPEPVTAEIEIIASDKDEGGSIAGNKAKRFNRAKDGIRLEYNWHIPFESRRKAPRKVVTVTSPATRPASRPITPPRQGEPSEIIQSDYQSKPPRWSLPPHMVKKIPQKEAPEVDATQLHKRRYPPRALLPPSPLAPSHSTNRQSRHPLPPEGLESVVNPGHPLPPERLEHIVNPGSAAIPQPGHSERRLRQNDERIKQLETQLRDARRTNRLERINRLLGEIKIERRRRVDEEENERRYQEQEESRRHYEREREIRLRRDRGRPVVVHPDHEDRGTRVVEQAVRVRHLWEWEEREDKGAAGAIILGKKEELEEEGGEAKRLASLDTQGSQTQRDAHTLLRKVRQEDEEKGRETEKTQLIDAEHKIPSKDSSNKIHDNLSSEPSLKDSLEKEGPSGRAIADSAFNTSAHDDSDDDTSSIASLTFSADSATNSIISLLSQYSSQDLGLAIDELIILLANDDTLNPLYVLAIESESIGGDRLERNLRRFLRAYSYELRKEANDKLERGAAHLVKSRARYVASAIRRKFEPRSENERTETTLVQEKNDVSSEEDDLEKSDEEDVPSLKQVKLFLVAGAAFENLRQNLRRFVNPEKTQPIQLPQQQDEVEQLLSKAVPPTGKSSMLNSLTLLPPSSLTLALASSTSDITLQEIEVPAELTSLPSKLDDMQASISEKQLHKVSPQEDEDTPHGIYTSTDADDSLYSYKEEYLAKISPATDWLDINERPNTNDSESLDTTLQGQEKGDLANAIGLKKLLPSSVTESDVNSKSPEPLCLSDNGRVFYLTPGSSIPDPGFLNGMKEYIELSMLGRPVNWWPLKPIDTRCPRYHTRISWYCGCGTKLYIDVTTKEAEEYIKQCSPNILASGSSTVLPIYNNTSTTSSSSSNNGQASSTTSVTQRSPSNQQTTSNGHVAKDTHQQKIIQETLRDRYVHWCVDANKFETKLNHIPIFSMKDVSFIHDLKAAYNSVMGIRRWFSLTSCYGVKFIIFERIHRTKELVACGPEDLPCPTTNPDYAYQYLDPRALFTKTLEKSLMHHFHNPGGCGAEDIEDVLSRIPKKVTGKLANKYGIQGYGMQAVSGWALWKFLLAILISQIGPLVFAAKWLWGGHPGDLQNAFMLSVWVFAAVGSVVVVPDVWKLRE